MVERGTPVVKHVILFAPNLGAGEAGSFSADFIEPRPDTVPGRTVDHVAGDHRRSGGGNLEGKCLTPKLAATFGVD